MNARAVHPKPPSNLDLADAFVGELADLIGLHSCLRLASLVLASRFRRGDPLPLPLQHHFSLERCDRAEDGEDQLTIDAAGIEVAEVEDLDPGTPSLGCRDDPQKVWD
jgi:hypothetical protein